MDLNATIDIIIKDLREAGDIIDDLKKYPGVPVLQIELARAKCKSAAEVIAMLKELKGKAEQTEDSAVFVRNIVVNKAEEGKQEVERVQITEFHSVREPEPEEAIRKKEPVQILKAQEPKLAVKKTAENAILADQFNNRAESYNEKIGNLKHEDDISQILKNRPVANLADAIGINDKFLFIREIFNGDAETYNDAIFRLNSAVNFDDASTLIAGYTKEDTDTTAIGQLMDLLKRKFHPNE